MDYIEWTRYKWLSALYWILNGNLQQRFIKSFGFCWKSDSESIFEIERGKCKMVKRLKNYTRLNLKWKVFFSFKIQRTGVIFRFKYGTNKDVGLPKFIFNYVGSKMLKETVAQGYGRHSKEEGFIDFFDGVKIWLFWN